MRKTVLFSLSLFCKLEEAAENQSYSVKYCAADVHVHTDTSATWTTIGLTMCLWHICKHATAYEGRDNGRAELIKNNYESVIAINIHQISFPLLFLLCRRTGTNRLEFQVMYEYTADVAEAKEM